MLLLPQIRGHLLSQVAAARGGGDAAEPADLAALLQQTEVSVGQLHELLPATGLTQEDQQGVLEIAQAAQSQPPMRYMAPWELEGYLAPEEVEELNSSGWDGEHFERRLHALVWGSRHFAEAQVGCRGACPMRPAYARLPVRRQH